MASTASTIYGAGVADTSFCEVVETYSTSGSYGKKVFIEELNFEFYDIAFYNDKVWYACNDSAYPVRIYNLAGLPAGRIPVSVIPAAHGMTFDDSGYLWVSDKNSDKLYRIQIEPSALTRSTWGSIKALLGE